MPDGPIEKGVGAGVAGIPVLPPELMPSSTFTVLKIQTVNGFQLLLQVFLDKCRLCAGRNNQLTINSKQIRIVDGNEFESNTYFLFSSFEGV